MNTNRIYILTLHKKEQLIHDKMEQLNDTKNGLNIRYQKQFYDSNRAWEIFEQLENEVEYNPAEESKVQVFGKWHQIPRQQTAYGDDEIKYKFSGVEVPAKPWLPVLQQIKQDLEQVTNQTFNFVLINRYNDGTHNIGYHKDDEGDLVHTTIASLSFGATRDFLLKKDKTVHKTPLGNGDLLLMCPPTNKHWKHSIPKRAGVSQPRISLTFRHLTM